MATIDTGNAAVIRESLGSTTLNIYNFTSIATSDTYYTGLPNCVGNPWMVVTSGHLATSGTAANFTITFTAATSGLVTWVGQSPAGNVVKGTLFVLSRT